MRGIGLALVALLFVVGPLQAEDGDAWQALREGRALLLLRHANAPGLGDPPSSMTAAPNAILMSTAGRKPDAGASCCARKA